MSSKHRWTATGLAALAAAVLGGILISPQFASAQDWIDPQTAQRIAAGFAATPVGVDLTGKDPLQVGLGAYIINTAGICNHCHSANQYQKAGFPLITTNWFGQIGNPYFLPPPSGPYLFDYLTRPDGGAVFKIDPTTFVAGGQFFGDFVSKNLTPDLNGSVSSFAPYSVPYAEGGIDWITYWAVLHNGVDIDAIYPQCAPIGTVSPGPNGYSYNGFPFPDCLSAPTNAALLQVMPWPTVRQLTDNDLNAVWQYLSSIPCTTNTTNINSGYDVEAGLPGTDIAQNYGAPVFPLISNCTFTQSAPPGTYVFYKYVNGRVVPVSGGPPLAAAPPSADPANAPPIQTAAGTSTPSCGLGIQPYPSCPPGVDDQRIAEGYRINPVPLNLTGLDPRQVGIGSYWVNSAGNCDGCHGGTNGGQALPGWNPADLPCSVADVTGCYTGSYNSNTVIPYNPAYYENPVSFVGGGANFGSPTGACDGSGMGGCGLTTLLVRNITPDFSTGHPLPEANTLYEFIQTLRTGHDFQDVHPNCPPGTSPTGTCVTAPADGSKLQVMPWPAAGSATDYDLASIYAYLTAIPCIPTNTSTITTGTAAPPFHTCPAGTVYGSTTGYYYYNYVNGHVVQVPPPSVY